MKKKILSIALVVALIAIMVSGTLAYFTAEDEVTNTFTVGSVKIEIYENGEETDEAVNPLGKLTPIVNTDKPSEDVSYIDKVVDVKNVGANAAYIRVHIAQPVDLLGYLELDIDETGWDRVFHTYMTWEGKEYIVVTYDFLTAVDPGEFTSELLKGAYLASDVDLEEDSNGSLWFVKKTDGEITHRSNFMAHKKTANGYTSETVNVLVASQAIQAQGFENGTATDALNTGFGVSTNPWK